MKRFIILFTAVLALASCALEEMETVYIDPNAESFDITVGVDDPETIGPHTKSSFTDAELSRISDINILIYHEGVFLKDYSKYITDLSSIKLTLPGGKDGFNIYLVGNVGEVDAPESESDIDELQYVVSSYNDFREKGFPVANVYRNYAKGSQTNLKVKRLVGQYNVKIDASATNAEYTVKDLRMINCALDVYPFATDKKATVFADDILTNTGDILTEKDIEMLNAGETVSLYFIENLQGVLLPDNTDRRNKIPSEIGQVAEYCTYIEITADIKTKSAQYTNGKYRYYLGQDETTDFSIRRNTVYNASLDFTQNMVSEEEWRIEVDQPEVHQVYYSQDDRKIIVTPYRKHELYVYCKTADITKVHPGFIPIEFFNYNPEVDHLQPKATTGDVSCSRTETTFNGYKAYKFVFNIKPSNSKTYKHSLNQELEIRRPYNSGNYTLDPSGDFGESEISFESSEKYNGVPLISEKFDIIYTTWSFPLLFKLERQPMSLNGLKYWVTLRGKNPFNDEIKISVKYTYNGNQYSTGYTKVTGELGETPNFITQLEVIDPTKLTRIDFDVTINGIKFDINQNYDGTPFDAKHGPDDNMYPSKFPTMKDDGTFDIYVYSRNGFHPTNRPDYYHISKIIQNADYGTITTKENFYCCDENQSVKYFSFQKELSEEGDTNVNEAFYFLNGGLTHINHTIRWEEMVVYPKEANRGADVYYYGPGRDLFFENKNGNLIDNEHCESIWISTWKNLLGRVKTEQRCCTYEGQLYMTINGCSNWPGSSKEANGYYSDTY